MIEYRAEQFPIFIRNGTVIGDSYVTVFRCEVDPDTDDVWVQRIAIEDMLGDEVLVINDQNTPGVFQHYETHLLKHHEDDIRERAYEDAAGRRTDARIAQMREPA